MNEQFPQRKSPRLQGYDYTQSGAYFVTICTYQRVHTFGHIHDDTMVLSACGKIACRELESMPDYWGDRVDIDLFVVMPNHIHVIVLLVGTRFSASGFVADGQKAVPTLGHVIGAYKSGVTRMARKSGAISKYDTLWQTRFHDHIIRNDRELNDIRSYVVNNPAQWREDTFFTQR
ncbi:MAG: transposase [Chloroflexota bacterium]